MMRYIFILLFLLASCRSTSETAVVQQAEFSDSSVLSVASMGRIRELLRAEHTTEEAMEVDFSIALPPDSIRTLPAVVRGKVKRQRTTRSATLQQQDRRDSLQVAEAHQHRTAAASEHHSEAAKDFKSSGSTFGWKVVLFLLVSIILYRQVWRHSSQA